MKWLNSMISVSQQIDVIFVVKTLMFFGGAWLSLRAYSVLHVPARRTVALLSAIGLTALGFVRVYSLAAYPADSENDLTLLPMLLTTVAALGFALSVSWVIIRGLEDAKRRVSSIAAASVESTQILNDIDELIMDRVMRAKTPAEMPRPAEFQQQRERILAATSK